MTTTSTKWAIDPTHSTIEFKTKHLMITTVSGNLKSYEATIETEGEDFTTAKINFSAAIDSITTFNEQRDGHLNSGDFFDAANFPHLTFISSAITATGKDTYEMTGSLTMKGVSNEVKLDVVYEGAAKDPWGNHKLGFTVTGKINRTLWNLNWNAALETGGFLIAEDVKINCEVQITKQA